ncbi:MAG TPA: PD-(D/E)XK nuclease family protein [Candidatus Acidoferrum sp.]|nr:PD-(D/E)XK nuclease family protein [Candidatus Acidoferrum sp.]
MTRWISHSEASVLLDCQAKHDFSYVDQLAGSSLKPKTKHLRLREGKAWGRAMAVYHERFGALAAHYAIDTSLGEDAAEMILEPEDLEETRVKLHALLDSYAADAEPLGVDQTELELDVQIPARSGKRASTLYRFTGFIDAIKQEPKGDWLVEFKLRGQLSSLEQVAFMRQIRWYAWGHQQQTGRPVAGVIVEERLNQEPKPARILANGLPSHATNQITTPGLYAAACRDAGITPQEDTLVALADRKWQARHTIFLTRAEIEEAGKQLTSVANLAGQFDSGLLYPTRNPSQFRCPSCAYRDICNTPSDADLVDALFDRVPAKKDRQEEVTPA